MQLLKLVAVSAVATAMTWFTAAPAIAQQTRIDSKPPVVVPQTTPKPIVRDHRTTAKPVVRDHRTNTANVRDHRTKTEDKATVRDHRGSENAAGGVKVTDSARKRRTSSGKQCVKSILGGPCVGGIAVTAAKAGKVVYDKSLAGEALDGTRKAAGKVVSGAKRGAKIIAPGVGN